MVSNPLISPSHWHTYCNKAINMPTISIPQPPTIVYFHRPYPWHTYCTPATPMPSAPPSRATQASLRSPTFGHVYPHRPCLPSPNDPHPPYMRPYLAALVFLAGLLALCGTAHASPTSGTLVGSTSVDAGLTATFQATLKPHEDTIITVYSEGEIKCTLLDSSGRVVMPSWGSNGRCDMRYRPSAEQAYTLVVANLDTWGSKRVSVVWV